MDPRWWVFLDYALGASPWLLGLVLILRYLRRITEAWESLLQSRKCAQAVRVILRPKATAFERACAREILDRLGWVRSDDPGLKQLDESTQDDGPGKRSKKRR